jgi:hypothetical protein
MHYQYQLLATFEVETVAKAHSFVTCFYTRAYIQRRVSICMERNFVCFFHGADPIAEVKVLISPFLR